MEAAPRLEPFIKEHFSPQLRSDGFAGSGRTYRRLTDGWIYVVNILGSRHGGAFAVNLAIHPVGVPDAIGRAVNPKTITQDSCELRRRLSESSEDQWWNCFGDPDSMTEALQAAANVYASHGRPLFRLVAGSPSPLDTLLADQLASGHFDIGGFHTTLGRMALLFARVRALHGRHQEATEFVQLGLSVAGHADLLRRDLKALVERRNDA